MIELTRYRASVAEILGIELKPATRFLVRSAKAGHVPAAEIDGVWYVHPEHGRAFMQALKGRRSEGQVAKALAERYNLSLGVAYDRVRVAILGGRLPAATLYNAGTFVDKAVADAWVAGREV